MNKLLFALFNAGISILPAYPDGLGSGSGSSPFPPFWVIVIFSLFPLDVTVITV
jgi:hypothetical protein